MDATIGINPVVARSENKDFLFGNNEKKLPFQRNAHFPPATNKAPRSTNSPSPKSAHLQNPHGGDFSFHSKAANKGFLSTQPILPETTILENNPVYDKILFGEGTANSISSAFDAHTGGNRTSPTVSWNNYLSSSANSVLRSHQVSISKKDGVSSDCQRLRGGSSWRRAAPAKLVNAVLHSNLFSHTKSSSSLMPAKIYGEIFVEPNAAFIG